MADDPLGGDLLGDGGDNRLIRTRHGVTLVNRHDSIVGRSLDYYGEYFEREVDLFRQFLRPGDVVVDVGANIGAHTVPLARMVGASGRVLAFEPVRLNHQLLCANVALNSLTWVDAIQGALGRRDETVMIDDVAMTAEGNYGALSLADMPGNRPVPVRRLDGLFDLPRLRFIKIDVEGMEADVLDGAREVLARFRPALYVENDRLDKSRDLLLLLQELDYDCYWFLASFHNPRNAAGKAEPMFSTGFVDDGTRIHAQGMGINLLCLPKAAKAQLAGFAPVLSVDEHPCRRECNARFTGGTRT